MVLPMVSARRKVKAPASAENGTSALWSLPTRILPICGTISPRKLMAPAMAVEILARSTAIREITIRVALTFSPRHSCCLIFQRHQVALSDKQACQEKPCHNIRNQCCHIIPGFLGDIGFYDGATPDIFPPLMLLKAAWKVRQTMHLLPHR